MAEAIAGFAVVSSILQVIDFTAKVTHHTIQLVRQSKEALEVQGIIEADRLAREYQSIGNVALSRLSLESQSLPDIRDISDLAETCKAQTGALIDLLQDLKVDAHSTGTGRILQSVQKAIKTQRKRKRIGQYCKHLENINSQLSTRVLFLLRAGQQEQYHLSSKLLSAIEENHESSIQTVLTARDEICNTLRDLTDRQAQNQTQPGTESRFVAHRRKLKSEFLETLLFRDMHARRDAISPAYETTFGWALTDESSGLRQWLSGGSGIFWISGKAGSGKSTLMKHLAQSSITESLLAQWVETSTSSLVMAKFYLWYAGSNLQRSVEGLIRGLLFQILSHCEDGERMAFPGQWQFARDYNRLDKTWSLFELVNGIRRLAAASQSRELMHENLPCRFCFFIDGLDEYKGDSGQLIGLLKDLTKGKQIKICASSRPWNKFRSAFEESCPSLKLEELTRSDIVTYVRGSLLSTASDVGILDQETSAEHPSSTVLAIINDIAQLIVEKAEGVFLWVELVVKSVQEGLWEGDSVAFLYQRLEAFPKDLETFFDTILDRVDRVYERNTAMVLQLAFSYVKTNDEKSNTKSNSAWIESDFTEFWLIRDHAELIMADPKFAQSIEVRLFSNQELQALQTETRTFLNACCKDLVHLPKPVFGSSGQAVLTNRVEFLHRTVFDYLGSDRMQNKLARQLPDGFGSPDTFRQMAMARCKFICVDEPGLAQRRFSAAASLQCHDIRRNHHTGPPALDESMILQYHDLGKVYRETLSTTSGSPGFRIEGRQVREVFTAFQCTAMITGDQELRGAAYYPEIPVLQIAALGLHTMRTFPVDQIDPELVKFLLGVRPKLCQHVWHKFVNSWMKFESKAVRHAQKNLSLITELTVVMFRQGIVDCGSTEDQDIRRQQEKEESDLADIYLTSRIEFLKTKLSSILDSEDTKELPAFVSDFSTANTDICEYVDYMEESDFTTKASMMKHGASAKNKSKA